MKWLILTTILVVLCVDLGQSSSSLFKQSLRRHHRDRRQVSSGGFTGGIGKILDFLQRKNLYRVYNVRRAVEEWQRLDSRSRSREETANNLKRIIKILVRKSSEDYDRQQTLRATNANVTSHSLTFRQLLKFYAQAPSRQMKYQLFDYFSDQLEIEGNFDKMSLDDAVIFSYVWIEEILNGGLIGQVVRQSPETSTSGWTEELLRKHKERNVRVVVRAANRIYPEGAGPGEPVTLGEWWLRQRQNSKNVYKVYHLIHAMVQALRNEGLEISTVYEAMVDEYKKAGRNLDAYELNMIDYLAYQSFGFIENSDPDRW